jgi:hypothetical protein
VIFIKEQKITDFDEYKNIVNIPISINVTFNDEYFGTFTISDEQQINEIHNLVTTRVYVKTNTPPPGSNRYVEFVYSDNEKYSLNSRVLTIKNNYYIPKNSDSLDYLLQTIGVEQEKLFAR